MLKIKKRSIAILLVISLLTISYWGVRNCNIHPTFKVGQAIDSLNGVVVYHNGSVNHVSGRNVAADSYNLGLKYQCVEFVKRYYYQHLNHKMPNSYGHAKDFFSSGLADGEMNTERGLIQYKNPSISKPKVNDLIVFDKTIFNAYGHVAIISNISTESIEIIQQNSGIFENSKRVIFIRYEDEKWQIIDDKVLGWLRKQ